MDEGVSVATGVQNIVLVFDTPDDQMRPPVVAYFVTWLLGRLLELTRDLACSAVDAFDKVTGPMSRRNGQNGSARSESLRDAWREAQITCLQAVLALWARLANMAASVCLQISRRLLRRERLERFGRRFRSDSIIWSTVLRSANIMFVMGWCASAARSRDHARRNEARCMPCRSCQCPAQTTPPVHFTSHAKHTMP